MEDKCVLTCPKKRVGLRVGTLCTKRIASPFQIMPHQNLEKAAEEKKKKGKKQKGSRPKLQTQTHPNQKWGERGRIIYSSSKATLTSQSIVDSVTHQDSFDSPNSDLLRQATQMSFFKL